MLGAGVIPESRDTPGDHAACVQIGTTNRCNAHCTFCFRDALAKPQGVMSPELFTRALVENPAAAYALYMFGEPVLDPHIVARVAETRALYPSANVYFHTNGGPMTTRTADALIDAGITRLVFSCYGTPEQHDRLMVGVRFDHVVKMVEHVRARGLPVLIISNKVEAMDVEWIRRFWEDRGASLASEDGFDWGDGKTASAVDVWYQCPLPKNYRFIDWDGSFVPCCIDFNGVNTFGNLAAERWETAALRIKHHRFPYCDTCGMKPKFDAWRAKL